MVHVTGMRMCGGARGGGDHQPIPKQRFPQAVREQHRHGDVILELRAPAFIQHSSLITGGEEEQRLI